MIVVNHETGLRFQIDNKSLVAKTIGLSRVQLWRWSKRYLKRTTWDSKFTVYFDEELYKAEKSKN